MSTPAQGPVEDLIVDATTGWARELNVHYPDGVRFILQVYVRVRGAQGEGIDGLAAANFIVSRLGDWLDNLSGQVLEVKSCRSLTSQVVPPGIYVLDLDTPAGDGGPRESALLVAVTRSPVAPPGGSYGLKLVSAIFNPVQAF